MVKNMTEEKVLAIITDFMNALEAATVNCKHQIAQLVEVGEPTWNPDKIVWKECTGPKGLYDRSEDTDNLQFKEMLRDLNSHGGRMNRNGMFYWLFKGGKIVGRKKRG